MEIEFEPYEKISFHSYQTYASTGEFVDVITCFHPPGVPGQGKLFWANGVLFRFFNHPPSEALASKIVNRHLIWDHIEVAPMPEYIAELKSETRPMVVIRVLNVSNHAIFEPLTKWLHTNLIGSK